MEKKLNVAIYTGAIPGPIFIENLINGLTHQNVCVYLFGRNILLKKYKRSNVCIFSTPNNKLLRICFVFFHMLRYFIIQPFKFFNLLSFYRKFSKTKKISFFTWWGKVLPVVNNLPDIFHIQWAKALPNWVFLKEIYGIKIVLSLRGAHINYSPIANNELANTYRELFPVVDYFHAVSKAIAKESEKYGQIKSKTKVIYSGINLSLLGSYKIKKFEIENGFHYISVGRHHWKKGYQYAIRAIRNLIDKRFKIHYTIIANGHPSEEILYMVDDLSLNSYVSFIHCSLQEQVYSLMEKSNCYLLPSVEEGIANSVLEAMAIGLPVITSDCGGMDEVIEHKKNGFLFQSRNIDQLTEIMQNVINQDHSAKKAMTELASNFVKDRHDIYSQGFKMKELYRSIVL